MKSIEINCKQCNNKINILKKEYNRQIKNGRPKDRFFCNNTCSGLHNGINLTKEQKEKSRQATINRNKLGLNKKGEFTVYLKLCRTRCKKRGYEMEIDDDYLKLLWEKQGGKCAITNVPLIKKDWTNGQEPNTASLDRIDSNLHYTKDNIQFVAHSINLAKWSYTEKQFNDFMKILKECI